MPQVYNLLFGLVGELTLASSDIWVIRLHSRVEMAHINATGDFSGPMIGSNVVNQQNIFNRKVQTTLTVLRADAM